MIYRNRAHIARLCEIVGFLGVLVALPRLVTAGFSGHSVLGAALIVMALVALGIAGAVVVRYYDVRADVDEHAGERIAVETLAKLGQAKARETKNKVASNKTDRVMGSPKSSGHKR